MNYSKGVWTYGKTNNFEYFDIDCDGNRICSVYSGIETPQEEQDQAEANAKLIASTPELLTCLENLNQAIDNYWNSAIKPDSLVKLINKHQKIAAAVIQKAT